MHEISHWQLKHILGRLNANSRLTVPISELWHLVAPERIGEIRNLALSIRSSYNVVKNHDGHISMTLEGQKYWDIAKCAITAWKQAKNRSSRKRKQTASRLVEAALDAFHDMNDRDKKYFTPPRHSFWSPEWGLVDCGIPVLKSYGISKRFPINAMNAAQRMIIDEIINPTKPLTPEQMVYLKNKLRNIRQLVRRLE